MARYSFDNDSYDPNRTPFWQKALGFLLLALVAGLINRCTTGSW